MFTVYQISGPESKSVYIGYVAGDGTNAMAAFLVGASRSGEDRGDVKFLADHNDDAPSLYALAVATEENEWEALLKRNELRAANPHSFTGPTMWPLGAYERAMKEDPQRAQLASAVWKLRQLPTARQAYAEGLWTFAQISALCKICDRKTVLEDLDKLTPTAFMVKYELGAAC